MNINELLSQRINLPQIKSVAAWASGSSENLRQIERMYGSDDRRTSVNALWIMTYLAQTDAEWIYSLRDTMIDNLLEETDSGKKRLLLQILRGQEYKADDIRTDFLDYCMSKINSECEPYAVRCYCMYSAYNMCCHFPELIAELEQHLEMMQYQPLSPGLKSALRQIKSKIKKSKVKYAENKEKEENLNRNMPVNQSERHNNSAAFDIKGLHTTSMGAERIRHNLQLDENINVVDYCQRLIIGTDAKFEHIGKNWYVTSGNIRLTVNASSKTIITAKIITRK